MEGRGYGRYWREEREGEMMTQHTQVKLKSRFDFKNRKNHPVDFMKVRGKDPLFFVYNESVLLAPRDGV